MISPEMAQIDYADACRLIFGALAGGLELPPQLTVSEWADAHRILPSETSREHGPWRTSRVPYAREIMDALSPNNRAERVVWMKAAQVGASEVGANWIGYCIQHDPGPMLIVQPTLEDARKFSKRRLGPLIEATPAVRALVRPPRARDSGNTLLLKEFLGGVLVLSGANAPSGLAGNPVRRIFFDEADRAPGEVGEEGDPLYLAEKRTSNFGNRKIYIPSTPTTEDDSRILRLFDSSDQRYYHVPCPHCGHMDILTWSGYRRFNDLEDGGHFRIAWDNEQPTVQARAETVHAVCPACDGRIEESFKNEALERGEWRPFADGDGRTIGFHLSGLYSPLGWLSWATMVREFLEGKNDPVRLKGWVNLCLGEAWRDQPDSVKPHLLIERRERYPARVPKGVGVLVAAADVQDYGLVYLVNGYGEGEESWAIEFGTIHGDVGAAGVWRDLDRIFGAIWRHESGQQLRIECKVVDSGGHHTDQVYEYCRTRMDRQVFPIRGGNEAGQELVGKWSRKNRARVKLYTLGVDSGKDTIHGRLRIAAPGPGFMHFPQADWCNAEFAAQLTAEVRDRKRIKGRGWTRVWRQIYEHNEAFDLEVYCLAALKILGPRIEHQLSARAARFAVKVASPSAESSPPSARSLVARRMPFRRGGWVTGGRR